MEQPSKCKFRESPSTVNTSGRQGQEDRRGPADDGWHPRSRSVLQVEFRILPHGVPIDLGQAISVCIKDEWGWTHRE